MTISGSLPPADRDKATAIVRRMLAGERPESFTADFIGKSGEHVILEVVGRPVLKDGVPVAVLGSARGITVRPRPQRRPEAPGAPRPGPAPPSRPHPPPPPH